MKGLVKNIIILAVIFLAIGTVFAFFSPFEEQSDEVTLSQVAGEINEEKVSAISIEENKLKIELTDGVKQESSKEADASLSESLVNLGVAQEKLAKVNISVKEKSGASIFWTSVLPFLIPFIFIAGFIWFMLRSVQSSNKRAMSFGQVKGNETKPKMKKVTFRDVAGVPEAKHELKELVEFLRAPQKFTALGAKIPKGALLVGPPGTGKTLLAEAVSGEANVPFFHISGSEFVEMFVGVGASRVRDLFLKAKKMAPSIIFVDEIDAVGRQRGAGLGGSHDEREQTLNQILVEMDGFDTFTNVIVIAATNRPDVLDPALLRPGRFDRRIVIDLPDIKEREAILKVHARKKPLAADVDLRSVAQRTPGFSGADLQNVLNEAAILTARRNKKEIGENEVFESIEKVMLGPERKTRILSKKEKKITAYHEAGHAIVSHLLPHSDPVHKVSIVSRGQAAGYTLKLPLDDRHLHSKAEFQDNLSVLLAGRIVEKKFFENVTTGAANDLKQATATARQLVTDFGMSDRLGPITYGDKDELIFLGREIGEQRNYSEKTAALIDSEVKRFISEAYKVAERVVNENEAKLREVADALIERETLEKEEFCEIMGVANVTADDEPEETKAVDKTLPEMKPKRPKKTGRKPVDGANGGSGSPLNWKPKPASE